jgi:hypothetical protein
LTILTTTSASTVQAFPFNRYSSESVSIGRMSRPDNKQATCSHFEGLDSRAANDSSERFTSNFQMSEGAADLVVIIVS